jgi:microcystin-dependent protein
MPIDFPSSPTLNQIYNYTGGSDVRFNKSFIYNGKAWEEIINYPGVIRSFAGYVSPAGWFFCNGTAYSRTYYAALFNVLSISTTGNTTISNATITNIPSTTNMDIGMPISGTNIQSGTKILLVNSSTSLTMDKPATAGGTGISFVVAPFGVGDGSTTFNVPDFSKKTPIGIGTGNLLTKRILGASGGEEAALLDVSNIPSHTHTLSQSPHRHTGVTSNNSQVHYHPTYTRRTGQEAAGYGLTIQAGYKDRVVTDSVTDYSYPGRTPQNVKHYHSFVTNTAVASPTMSYPTTGTAYHANMQPYSPVNFIIKY